MEKSEPYDFATDYRLITGSHAYSPEKALLCAILQRAIMDLSSRESHWKNSAWQFLLSRSQDEFSMIWICNKLDLNYLQIRAFAIEHADCPILKQRLRLFNW